MLHSLGAHPPGHSPRVATRGASFSPLSLAHAFAVGHSRCCVPYLLPSALPMGGEDVQVPRTAAFPWRRPQLSVAAPVSEFAGCVAQVGRKRTLAHVPSALSVRLCRLACGFSRGRPARDIWTTKPTKADTKTTKGLAAAAGPRPSRPGIWPGAGALRPQMPGARRRPFRVFRAISCLSWSKRHSLRFEPSRSGYPSRLPLSPSPPRCYTGQEPASKEPVAPVS